MNSFQISSSDLNKALQIVSGIMSQNPSQRIRVVEESHEDLLFYDNVSMMDKLNVSERTLQRLRKQGEIRFTKFGGKVYYPKNFMVTPPVTPEGFDQDSIPINEFVRNYNTPKPKSKIIDVDKLLKRITYFPREHNADRRSKINIALRLKKAYRKKRYPSLELWPKKIKLIGLPIKITKIIPLLS